MPRASCVGCFPRHRAAFAFDARSSRCHLARSQGEAIEAAVQTETADLDTAVLPVRAYLDRTVVPLLLQGLAQLAKER